MPRFEILWSFINKNVLSPFPLILWEQGLVVEIWWERWLGMLSIQLCLDVSVIANLLDTSYDWFVLHFVTPYVTHVTSNVTPLVTLDVTNATLMWLFLVTVDVTNATIIVTRNVIYVTLYLAIIKNVLRNVTHVTRNVIHVTLNVIMRHLMWQ